MRHTTLSEMIAHLRREAGLTQAQLARAAGASEVTIWHAESGTRVPTVEVLLGIAQALADAGAGMVPDEADLALAGTLLALARAAARTRQGRQAAKT